MSMISAATGVVKKVNISNPKSHPLLKDYFTPENKRNLKTDNGVQVYSYPKDISMDLSMLLIAKKSGKTLWKKQYHPGVSLLAVEGNLIFLDERSPSLLDNSPSNLVVLNTKGKTLYRTHLNGSIAYDGYESVSFGDVLYFVTDRYYDRISEGRTTPGKKYSRVLGISIITGKILWSKSLGVVNRPPALYKGKIYVTDQSSKSLISFDSKGNEKVLIKDSFYDAPQFSPKGQIYMKTIGKGEDDTINVYDKDFHLSWKKTFNGYVTFIIFDQDLIYIGSTDFEGTSWIYTLTDKGKLQWSIRYQGENSQGVGVSGNKLFFINKIENPQIIHLKNEMVVLENRIYGISKSTGSIFYKSGLGSYSFPTYQIPIAGKSIKPTVPIIEEKSRSGKLSYYLLK
ncbi:hypothetical protein J2Y67_002105 [Neobacillus niacini]|nr:hypothetical protein [Neobacillus niacini]